MAKDLDAKVTKKPSKSSKSNLLTLVLALLLLGSAAFGGVFFKKYQDLKAKPPSAEESSKKENERIINEVGELYALPKDEEPTILVVKDKDKLTPEQKQQELFQKAENNDVILIYTKAKTAILYRQSTKQLVDVRQVTLQSAKVNVGIVGSSIDRATAEAGLASLQEKIAITTKNDAKGSYTESLVVDLSGKNSELAGTIASTLKNAKVGPLPTGEDKPVGVDILVIAAPATTAP